METGLLECWRRTARFHRVLFMYWLLICDDTKPLTVVRMGFDKREPHRLDLSALIIIYK